MIQLPPFALATLQALVTAWQTEHAPSQILSKTPDDPYLSRWYVHRDRERGNVYFHRTHRSDADPELHDHPFDNVTIVIEGEIREILPEGSRILRPGDVVVRRAADLHRLEIEAPTRTIFITGPKVREWGFACAEGWLHNQEFFHMRGYR